jgi:hypothetical protein
MLSLDVRRMARKGCLTPGRSGTWSWSRGDGPAGTIGYRAEVNSLCLIYTWTPDGGNSLSMDYAICLTRTPCHYGNTRQWFTCPRCGDVRAILYGTARDGRFGCRGCLRLAYASEAESVIDRTWRIERKLESRLFGDERGQRKRMWGRTRDRLIEELEAVQDRREDAMSPGLARLLARLDPAFGWDLLRELRVEPTEPT